MPNRRFKSEIGPFLAEQLNDGDRYELAHGHPVYCQPGGRPHAGTNLTGASVLDSDPATDWAGVDPGFSVRPNTLYAPDIAVAPPGPEEGWIKGVPPLAVEYAARGQDHQALHEKIQDLLACGTRWVWVVHLVGPRRVEIHEAGADVRTLGPGDLLLAPGVLQNPVPVEALYDRDAAHRATLKNLLQRFGYADLEAVKEEGRQEGIETGRQDALATAIVDLLTARGLAIDAETHARIRDCRDTQTLQRWLLAAARVDTATTLFR